MEFYLFDTYENVFRRIGGSISKTDPTITDISPSFRFDLVRQIPLIVTNGANYDDFQVVVIERRVKPGD